MAVAASVLVQLRADIANFVNPMKQAVSSLDGLKKAIGSIQAASFIYLAKQALSVGEAFVKMAEDGAQAIRIQDTFENVSKSFGVNADQMIGKMKEVSGVWMEDTEAMRQSSRLLSAGFDDKQIIKMTEAARVASRFLGTSFKNSFDLVTNAAITMQTRGLKQAFNIDSENAIKSYAEAIGTLPKYLNEAERQTAIYNRIVEESDKKLKQLGGTVKTDVYEQFERMGNIVNAVKELLQIGMIPVVGALATAMLQLASWVLSAASAYAKFESILTSMHVFQDKKEQAEEVKYWKDLGDELGKAADKLDELAILAAAETLNTTSVAIDELQKKIKLLNDSMSGKKEEPSATGGKKKIPHIAGAEEIADRAQLILKFEKEASDIRFNVFNAGQEQIKNAAIINAMELGQDVDVITRQFAENAAKTRLAFELDKLDNERVLAIEEVRKQGLLTMALKLQIDSIYAEKAKAETIKTGNEITAIEIKGIKERTDALREAYEKMGYGYEVPTDKESAEMDARSAQLRRDQAISTADLNREVLELQGNWLGARNAEMDYNNATLDNYLKTNILTGEQEKLLIQLNQIKNEVVKFKSQYGFITDFTNQLGDTFINIFSNMADSTKTFADRVKDSFKSMADSVLAEIERMIIKWLMWKAISGLAGGGEKGAGVATSILGNVGKLFGSFAEGGIIKRPTIALRGEAGPEAVIPLSDKKALGGGDTYVYINAVDTQSFDDAIRRNPGSILKVIRKDERENIYARQ